MNTKILHDSDIREPLFDFLEESLGKIRILEEKQTGRARADVVMVTEKYLYGIEIKSDADTYARLNKQVRYYDQYYDRNIVVVGSMHAAHIEEHVPEWWGILSVDADRGQDRFLSVAQAPGQSEGSGGQEDHDPLENGADAPPSEKRAAGLQSEEQSICPEKTARERAGRAALAPGDGGAV